MKILIKQIIPYTCIGTTLALMITTAYNLFHHYDTFYYTNWLIIIAGIFLLYTITFGVLGQLNYKSILIHDILVYLLWYIGFGAIIFITHWMGWKSENVLYYTLIMTGCYILIVMYDRKQTRMLADEINALMEKNQND